MIQEIFQLRKIAFAAIISTLVLLGALTVAFAQTSNDNFDDATIIGELPYTDTLDTTSATRDYDDPITCYEQDHTVWYTFTPSSDMRCEVNTFGSDYDTVLSVYTGSRGELNEIACNDDVIDLQSLVRFDAIAETTYYIMVGSLGISSSGGNLVLTVDIAPPPLTIDIDIDPVGSVDPKNMVATLSGTLTCSRPAVVDLYIELKQKAGRQIIHGSYYISLECNGETPWVATVTDYDGVFVGGKATVNAYANVFDIYEYSNAEATNTVQLKGKGKKL
jgi:hypothetical protein